MNIIAINGSPNGSLGNSALFIKSHLKITKEDSLEVFHLAKKSDFSKALKKITSADAVVFVTGTYWDSWGSPMQAFFEALTPLEGHPSLMGKPCACIILMHSVGGKSVLSRMQGILNTMGFVIPPMSGLVYSLVNQLAKNTKSLHAPDFWSPDDWAFILNNLRVCVNNQFEWHTWPFDNKDPKRIWLK